MKKVQEWITLSCHITATEASCGGTEYPAKDTDETPIWRQYPARIGDNLSGSEKPLCGALSPTGKIHGSVKLEGGSITLNDPLWDTVLLSTQFWDMQGRGSALLPGSKSWVMCISFSLNFKWSYTSPYVFHLLFVLLHYLF